MFGTWNDAIREAGLIETRILTDEEEMIRAIQDFAKAYPNNMTWTKYQEAKWKPSVHAIKNRFGSWIEALIKAGFDPTYRFYEDEELLDHLIYCANKVAPQKLTYTMYEEMGNRPANVTIAKRFGGWKKALEKAKEYEKEKELELE
jgi:hypothetical protein